MTLVDRTMGDTPTGGIVETVAPVLVMAIATFMILDQLKIANNIVMITYAAIVGAVALGMALAFGLGGRDVAGRLLENAYARAGGQRRRQARRAHGSRTRQDSRRRILPTNAAPPPAQASPQPTSSQTSRRFGFALGRKANLQALIHLDEDARNGQTIASKEAEAGRGRAPGDLGDAKEKVGADGDADQAEGKAKQGGGELKETWGEAKEKAGDLWEKAKDAVDSDDEPNR